MLRDLSADEYGARLLPRTGLSRVSISWLRVAVAGAGEPSFGSGARRGRPGRVTNSLARR